MTRTEGSPIEEVDFAQGHVGVLDGTFGHFDCLRGFCRGTHVIGGRDACAPDRPEDIVFWQKLVEGNRPIT